MVEVKQVIAARSDIKMGKGKLAAQVAHAALGAAEASLRKNRDWYDSWKEQGQAKVVVKVEGEETLIDLQRQARNLGLPTSLIQDMGLTQLDPGTTTCLGIGPAPSDLIDRVTGKLKLL